MSTQATTQTSRRNLGWRKPVPKFVPSPPPSRPTSMTWNSRLFHSIAPNRLGRQLPPLPQNQSENSDNSLDESVEQDVHDEVDDPPIITNVEQPATVPHADANDHMVTVTLNKSSPQNVPLDLLQDDNTKLKPNETSVNHVLPPPVPRKLETRRSTHRVYHPPTPQSSSARKPLKSASTFSLNQRQTSIGSSEETAVEPSSPPSRAWGSNTAQHNPYPVHLPATTSNVTMDTAAVGSMYTFPALRQRSKPSVQNAKVPELSASSLCCSLSAWRRLTSWLGLVRLKLIKAFGLSLTPSSVKY